MCKESLQENMLSGKNVSGLAKFDLSLNRTSLKLWLTIDNIHWIFNEFYSSQKLQKWGYQSAVDLAACSLRCVQPHC